MELQARPITDDRGVERCQNIKEAAVHNVPGDDSKGFHQAKAYCNRPMTFSVSQKRKVCPDCYKEPVVGYPEPKITNANGVVLSVKEMAECGLNPDGTRLDGKEIPVRKADQPVEAPIAVEAKVEIKKDSVVVSVPLNELEANGDVAAYLIQKVIDGFGDLPVTNFKESKRLIQLEEKLTALLRG